MGNVGWLVSAVCATLVLLLYPQGAEASGFSIYDFGAAEQAKGNAVVAQVDAPSAVFYNPAGLAGLEGTDLQVGTTAVFPKTTFQSNVTGLDTRGDAGPAFPSYLFVSQQVGRSWGMGLGIFAASGNKVDYPNDWEGRFVVTSAELRQVHLAPSMAYRVSPQVSVGAGLVLTRADFQQASQIDLSAFGLPEGTAMAFTNLLTNAIEAMPNGGTLTLRIFTTGDEGIQVEIQDSGSGIRQELQEHLFKPFITTKIGGTGLGLWTARRIIEAHHAGRLVIDSVSGKGTVVRVWMPTRSPTSTVLREVVNHGTSRDLDR